ncbi:hypothetical protein [Cohnella zeiphila]|uniref:Uncharacterized protein n=1 Tax=Cohnella zeiphila TaxID=2761120 RepID=A0A7X0VXG9_9BACL|nr:hypothetical protein [Cohnella zeiphila]MBB6731918.1 hypothetical protein [Cohnella zeiphila]
MLSEEKIARTTRLLSFYLDGASPALINDLDEIFTELRTLQQQSKQMKEALERVVEVKWDYKIAVRIAKDALQSLQGSDTN